MVDRQRLELLAESTSAKTEELKKKAEKQEKVIYEYRRNFGVDKSKDPNGNQNAQIVSLADNRENEEFVEDRERGAEDENFLDMIIVDAIFDEKKLRRY